MGTIPDGWPGGRCERGCGYRLVYSRDDYGRACVSFLCPQEEHFRGLGPCAVQVSYSPSPPGPEVHLPPALPPALDILDRLDES